MRTLRTVGLGVLLAATLAIGGVASGNTPAGPNNDPGDGPAAVALPAIVPAALQQNLFTPITPCRIVDTRSAGGKFTPFASRSYYVAGSPGFAPQGGTSGGCGIPVGATAVAAGLKTVAPSGTGYFRGWPTGTGEPNATLFSYDNGGDLGDGVTVKIGTGAGKQFTVKNYKGSAHLLIDVTGYYRPQIYGTFSTAGDLYSGTGRLTAYAHLGTGYYTVRADQDLTGCTPVVSSYYYGYIAAAYASGQYVNIQMTTNAGAGVDYYFQVHVNC